MKKMLTFGLALLILALVFAGCPTEAKEDSKTDPVITGISLRVASGTGTPSSTKPAVLRPGDVRTFSAVVSGTGSFNAAYSIDIEILEGGEDLATVADADGGAKTVTIKSEEGVAGELKITAVSTGDLTKTAEWIIAVNDEVIGGDLDFSDAAWIVVNTAASRGVSLNASTTNTVPAANADKRYVVFNNEPMAQIDQDGSLAVAGASPNSFRDATIMYLNKPFTSDIEDWKAFGIEARVRISAERNTAPIWGEGSGESWGSVRQGFIIGAIEDPELINPTFDASGLATENNSPSFVGIRRSVAGQTRAYLKRAGTDGLYGSQAPSPSVADNDTNMDIPGTTVSYSAQSNLNAYNDGGRTLNFSKKEAFAEQEYIFKVMRNAASTWRFYVSSSDGTEELFSFPLAGSNLPPNDKMVNEDPVYLGFIVYGVEVEISDVKIHYNGEVAWTDQAVNGATPKAVTASRVEISAAENQTLPGDTENDYSCLADEFPADGVQVSAVVVPYTVSPRTVTWGLESGSQSVEVVPIGAEAVVTRDGSKTGDGIITATPNAGGNAGTFKFYLHDESAIVTPTFVNITGPSPMPTSLDEGDTVNYTAEVGPVGAPQDVTWEVFAEDGTSATTAATIDSDGILTAGTTAEDTVVKVVATAADTSVKSTAVSITIKKSTGEISRNWTFGPGTLVPWEDIDSGTPNTETLSLAGGLTLIPPTGGARWYSGRVQSNMGYTGTYQPGAAGVFGEIDDFGVPVKVTIIWTHTGDTAPNPDRNMYIKFGEDPQIDNPIGASGNLASAATFETATFSATGQGKVEFGATGSLRIYEIKVESVGEDEGPYYLWEAATSESFSLGSSPASRVVNGKTWTRMSGTFTVNTSGIAFPSSGGGRLVIGSASTDATTSTTTDPAGEFDFSKAKRLTISYNGFDGGGNFQVYVNNNTTGQANSVLGGASRIYSATALTGDDIVLTINPSAFGNDASLANAFIYLRTESAVSAMNITKILIEDM